jgi:hypothetical protein
MAISYIYFFPMILCGYHNTKYDGGINEKFAYFLKNKMPIMADVLFFKMPHEQWKEEYTL